MKHNNQWVGGMSTKEVATIEEAILHEVKELRGQLVIVHIALSVLIIVVLAIILRAVI